MHHALGVSYTRLSRQQSVKIKQCVEPFRSMTKSKVESEHLSQYVVMPQGCDLSFMVWRKSLDSSSTITVQFPHERHGHASKTSHAAKVETKMDFLNFVDFNSQHNGCSADSSSATQIFLQSFKLFKHQDRSKQLSTAT